MKFLTVLVVVFLYRNWVGGHPLRERLSAGAYFEWFRSLGVATNLRYFLCVGIPVIVVLIVSINLGGWILGLAWFAFALLVMLYAVDIYDEDTIFEDQAAWLAAPDDADMATMVRRQEDFRLVTTYEIFQSIYPALFWFFFVGPAGGLAYVLTRQYLDGLDDDDDEIDLVERVVYFMEWPAARVSGLLFALLGHFGRTFDVWLDSLGDLNESIGTVLSRMAVAALDVDEPDEASSREVFAAESEAANEQLRRLMDRTLFGWLGVAALVTIVGL